MIRALIRDTFIRMILLDGPLGTELLARGVPTPLPEWSATSLREHSHVVGEIHQRYARSGAIVHTANTFRTKRRTCPLDWEVLARRAVKVCRESIPKSHRVAASIAPLADCYRPDLSPANPEKEHQELAEVLKDAGVDILLCETFPHIEEGLSAVAAAVKTGVETWISWTPGPGLDLLSKEDVARGTEQALRLGAKAALVNCLPAVNAIEYLEALLSARAKIDEKIPVGVYANTGQPEATMGFQTLALSPQKYVEFAKTWVEAGATLVGGCCGTGPDHILALSRLETAE